MFRLPYPVECNGCDAEKADLIATSHEDANRRLDFDGDWTVYIDTDSPEPHKEAAHFCPDCSADGEAPQRLLDSSYTRYTERRS